jgi:hypothetical protein
MTNNFPTDSLNSSGSEDVLEPICLPFSAATLAKHFAPVGVSVNTPEDYLRPPFHFDVIICKEPFPTRAAA